MDGLAVRGTGVDPAVEGERIQRRSQAALGLASIVPMLAFTYATTHFIVPHLPAAGGLAAYSLYGLLLATALAMIAGGYIIWTIGQMVARMGRLLSRAGLAIELTQRRGEVDHLTTVLSSMVATMEKQARDIATLAGHLDVVNGELERKNGELKTLSFKDELTGLYNRRFFDFRLEDEMAHFRRSRSAFAVVLLDLDGFKALNDSAGHAAGDAALQTFAETLAGASRAVDVVARRGGDEFAVLLIDTSLDGAAEYAERTRRAVEAQPALARLGLTASLGVAAPDPAHPTAEALLDAADAALYAAKDRGRNQVATAPASSATGAPACGAPLAA